MRIKTTMAVTENFTAPPISKRPAAPLTTAGDDVPSGVVVAVVTVLMGEEAPSPPVGGLALEELAVVEIISEVATVSDAPAVAEAVLEALPLSLPVEPEAVVWVAARVVVLVVEAEAVDFDPPSVLSLFALLSAEELDAELLLLVFTELLPLLVLAVTVLSTLVVVLVVGSASLVAVTEELLERAADADTDRVCELAVLGAGGDSKLPELADTCVLVCSGGRDVSGPGPAVVTLPGRASTDDDFGTERRPLQKLRNCANTGPT